MKGIVTSIDEQEKRLKRCSGCFHHILCPGELGHVLFWDYPCPKDALDKIIWGGN